MQIAFYVSGNATRVKNIIKRDNVQINKSIVFVVTDEENEDLKQILYENNICYILANENELKRVELNFSDYMYYNLSQMDIDYLFVFGKKLLKGLVLKKYKNRMINFHPSILPLYPGFNAIDRALKDGMQILGNTAHFIDESIDGGPIIMQNIVSNQIYIDEGYEGVLKSQEDMFFKIYNMLEKQEIYIENNKVKIKNAKYKKSFFIPE